MIEKTHRNNLLCFPVMAIFMILLLAPISAVADGSLAHNIGKVEMMVSDWGALCKLDNEQVYPNFTYNGKYYLDPFSEIWAGDSVGNVASAYDILENDLAMGEWAATAPSGSVKYVSDYPTNSQIIHAQYAPLYNDFPFDITVDQYSYAWDPKIYPDDGDYVIMKLILTNRGASELKDFFLAAATNWDVNYEEWEDDLMDWDGLRLSGVAFDADMSDPTYLALTLISGKLASHNIIDASTWSFLDSDRSKIMSNGEYDNIRATSFQAGNYMNVISVGPYNIPAGGSVSAVYAFVAGRNLKELQKNIDSSVKRALVPADLTAAPGEKTISLSWRESIIPDITTYKVYKSVGSNSGYSEIASLSADTRTYIDTDVKKGTIYYYVVTAIRSSGTESIYSNEIHTSPGVAPPPPGSLNVRSDSSSRPVLYWDQPEYSDEISEYRIFRNLTGSDPWTAIASVKSAVHSYPDENTYDGNKYYYTVAAVNSTGWISKKSNVVSFTVDLSKSPESVNNLNQVKIVPNPCKISSKLKFTQLTANANIYIYTHTGELVKTLYHDNGSGEEEWDMRNDAGNTLSSGIYVYHIEAYMPDKAGKFTTSGKFAIVK